MEGRRLAGVARGALLACVMLGCAPSTVDSPEPGEFQVGLAQLRMPVPVGIGTVGFAGFGLSGKSPFSDLYPATVRVHGHPEISVVAMSRGEGFEAILVRLDTVGVFQQLRQGVLAELRNRLGRDLDDALILGATHTHSGPGRVIDGGGPYDLIADRFFPEFYERMVLAIADAVEQALADLRPGRMGHVIADLPAGHQDRRCEDGLEYTNDSAPIVVLEREGRVDALVMAYAIHGTVLGIDQLTLSQDVSGAIEDAVSARFSHPVTTLLLNSWGADVAPTNPTVDEQVGASLPEGYDQMERVASVVADDVHASLQDLSWTDSPAIHLQTHRVRIDREWIGYDLETFPHEYGGVYCSVNEALLDCDPETDLQDAGLDQSCVPFPEDFPAPNQTVFTAGTVGPLSVVTFPGEPGTLLAEQVMAEMRSNPGVEDVLFLGYAQDYLGYSILEEDWWQGGYEASGALWGPRQGEFLAEAAALVFNEVKSPSGVFSGLGEPEPIPSFDVAGYEPYVAEIAVDLGTVLVDVEPSYGPTDVISFSVAGADPWLGTPIAWLETADGEAVVGSNTAPIHSDDYGFWIGLEPEPTYKDEPDAEERVFHWTVHLPASRRVPGLLPELSGSYQLRMVLPSDEEGTTVEVVSGIFAVGTEP